MCTCAQCCRCIKLAQHILQKLFEDFVIYTHEPSFLLHACSSLHNAYAKYKVQSPNSKKQGNESVNKSRKELLFEPKLY